MNTALQALGYRTWLDVEQMSASKVFLKKMFDVIQAVQHWMPWRTQSKMQPSL
jgi:hypothetical protein